MPTPIDPAQAQQPPLIRLRAFVRSAQEGHHVIAFTANEAKKLLALIELEEQELLDPYEEPNETLAEFCIEQLKAIASDNSAAPGSRVAAIELLERFTF
jgi:hypothetical protein